MEKPLREKNTARLLAIVIALSLLLLWPLFRSGYWESDDGEWMVIRFSAMHESLRDGHFPVRWTGRLNHHYGYPVFNFLYPLPFYLAEIPYLLRLGPAGSIKVVFGASVLLASTGMFLFAKKWGEKPAFLATILYIFAPYRTFLLYTRGSLGESVALAVVPFVFLFADKLMKKPSWKTVSGLGISYSLIIMSHNVVALLFTPFFLLYIAKRSLQKNSLSTLRPALYAFFLGLSLSAFFWIPALYDLQYTKAGGIQISDYQSYLLEARGLLARLGYLQVAFLVLALVGKSWFFSSMAVIAAFFMHPVSLPVVKAFPLIEKIQFPWRMATVFSFSAAAAAAEAAGKMLKNMIKPVLFTPLVVVILVALTLPATKNVRFINREEGFYTTNDDTTTVKNEFTPRWVSEPPKNKQDNAYRIEAREGSFQVIQEDFRSTRKILQLRLSEPATVTFNTHYFPGWNVYVDDQLVKLDPSQTGGLLQIEVQPGRDKLRDVKAVFEPTPVRKTSETISLIALGGMVILAIVKGIRRGERQKATGILLFAIATVSSGFFIFTNLSTYRKVFLPQEAEAAFLNSQWVNPDAGTNIPIGDHGLYSWAGWEYVHGKNPILINPEMPPLGKYLIGAGLITIKRPAVIGAGLAIFAIITLFFLAREILKDRWAALSAVSLFAIEPVMRNLINITMLDGLQIGFLNLSLLFFIKALKKKSWFFASSLALGAMASTKFFAGAATVVLALFAYLVLKRNWKAAKTFALSLPLAGFVHIVSYASFFTQGGNLLSYLGTQKWILNFYRQGNVGTVPTGSYWLLVLFNKWRIWFGEEWGVFTTVRSDLWRASWPLNVFSFLTGWYLYAKNKLTEEFGVILVWLATYSIFLTLIIGWPHYMLLFLPYAYILLVELGKRYLPVLETKVNQWKKQRNS